MKLYLVRHGQSLLNARQLHQHSSVELSEHGIKQATTLAERFRDIPVDIIMASPYERARKTAEIIGKTVQKPVQSNPLLVEIKRPSEIEGRPLDEPEVVKIKDTIKANAHDPNWRYSDEETFFDIRERARTFLAQLDTQSEENILVVTHGLFIRMIVCVMAFGEDLTPAIYHGFMMSFVIGNTGIIACQRETASPWQVLQWNDDAHLGEL